MSDDNTPTVAPTAFQPYTGFIIVLVLYLGSMLGLSIYGGLLNKEGSTTSMYAKIRTHFFGDTGKANLVVSYFVIGVSMYSNTFSG